MNGIKFYILEGLMLITLILCLTSIGMSLLTFEPHNNEPNSENN